MASRFIKYEDCLLSIEGVDIFAESAQFSAQSSLAPIKNITGSIIRYAPTAPLRGTLSFSHYATGVFYDFLNPLTAVEHTGEPLQGSFGPLGFSSGYLRSLSFSVSPYSPIIFNSEIDIYGDISYDEENDQKNQNNTLRNQSKLSHSLRTYLVGTDLGIDKKVSFSYSVTCSRSIAVNIGSDTPSRVSKENVQISMSINGEDIGSSLPVSGDYAAVKLDIYDTYNEASPLCSFGCTGQITSKTFDMQNGGYGNGSLSITQEFLTGRQEV